MKRIILVLTALTAAFTSANAGKIVTDSLSSKVLGATVKYNVYLPESYGKTDCSYPVIYLLHGLSDNCFAWPDKGHVKMIADELVQSGELKECIILMPNAGDRDTHNIYNGYFNMPGWNYEDFFFTEFIPQMESKYSCGGSKGRRAIMGLSMGGGGSTVYSQRHPDKFSSCYAMSAWLTNVEDEVKKPDVTDKLTLVCNAVCEHSALDFIDNADDKCKESLRTVKWFFDCGDDDELLDMNTELHRKMKKAGIKAELRVRNGIHNWEYWRGCLRTALPFASRNFD